MSRRYDLAGGGSGRQFSGVTKRLLDRPRFVWWLMRVNPKHRTRSVFRGFSARRRVAASGLFDADWYRQRYPDVADADIDPLYHFIALGASQGRDPNPLFDTRWYLSEYSDVARANLNPLDHYLASGAEHGCEPAPWFDTASYLARHPEADRDGNNPLFHFLSRGMALGHMLRGSGRSEERKVPGPSRDSAGVGTRGEPGLSSATTNEDVRSLWKAPGWLYFLLEFGSGDTSAIFSLLSDFQLLGPRSTDRQEHDPAQIDRWAQMVADLAARRTAGDTDGAVDVSIVVPVHNQLRYTLACLASLVFWPVRATFEVIVADDASTDATARTVRALPSPFRLVSQPVNVGFLRNCNRASASANGRYILFLNNDTLVLPGWLDELVDTLVRNADAGLVGSKLLYADGVLQEAGGLVWEDGSGWNVGIGENARAPSFNFCREVDYCSGASMIVPRALWSQLGGFDERYAPAYFEDTDLAFRVRKAGYKVLYQPLTQLIHFEGKSHGTDLSAGVKRYQVVNRETFVASWRTELAEHRRPTRSDPYCLGRYMPHRALYVDAYTPTPDQDSGSVDAVNLMRMLKELGIHVTFLPATSVRHDGRYTRDLQKIGIECLYDAYALNPEKWLKQYGARLSLVVLSRLSVASNFLSQVRRYCPNAKVVFNTVDLQFLREGREADVQGTEKDTLQLVQTQNMELELIDAADAAIVVSDAERRLLDTLAPSANVVQIPLPRDIPDSVADPGATDIVFIAGYKHAPNVDGARYFVGDILPLVRARVPDARVVLAGSNMPGDVAALAGPGVETRGFVADLADLFGSARLSVAPLRYGAGRKGKVVTSLSYGIPTVATSIAAEGMDLTDGQHLLVADSPQAFADAVVRVLTDDRLWTHLSSAGRRKVEEAFGYPRVAAMFGHLLGDLCPAIGKRPAAAPAIEGEEMPMPREHAQPPALASRLKRADFVVTPSNSLDAFQQMLRTHEQENAIRQDLERALIDAAPGEAFQVSATCRVCETARDLHVDYGCGGVLVPEPRPNWRESLVCPGCGLANRMRATLHLLDAVVDDPKQADVYFTEQVTALFESAKKRFPRAVGSEYLRDGTLPGRTNADGVRHENVTRLTFADGSFDALVTLDVLEHVPDTVSALGEFSRVLKPGGVMVLTAPFVRDRQDTLVRARVDADGSIEHLEEPEYHGDPMDHGGVLCYYHFGWDLLDRIRTAGFSEASVVSYWSARWGYLGVGQIQIVAVK